MSDPVTVYYLEMTRPDELRPKASGRDDVSLQKVGIPSLAYSRFLYDAVGHDWHWVRRHTWTDAQWMERLACPEFHTWILYVSGTPAGYFEFHEQPGRNVEVVQLGLLPQFIGHGLGGYLVTCAVEEAWKSGASRVWLHTCTLDHPRALANYQARGFRLFKQETKPSDL